MVFVPIDVTYRKMIDFLEFITDLLLIHVVLFLVHWSHLIPIRRRIIFLQSRSGQPYSGLVSCTISELTPMVLVQHSLWLSMVTLFVNRPFRSYTITNYGLLLAWPWPLKEARNSKPVLTEFHSKNTIHVLLGVCQSCSALYSIWGIVSFEQFWKFIVRSYGCSIPLGFGIRVVNFYHQLKWNGRCVDVVDCRYDLCDSCFSDDTRSLRWLTTGN